MTPRLTPSDASVEAVAGLIEAQPAAPHTLDSLATAVSLSPSHLRRLFVARYGMTPAAYRQSAPGLEIAWDTDTSALGTIVLGATDKGLCCVIFTNESSAQEALANEFPRATLRHDPAAVAPH
ncbi:MAG: AraC family transcriptional regulator, partial [Coriobacteriia bacterium]|nr:AraC family transcriptional regulator [Coriobacteriia bacterium]